MVGIKETKEALVFGLEVGAGVFAALKDDGKVTVGDALVFTPAMVSLPAALDGADQIPAELKDLDENELMEIKDLVLGKLPTVGDKWYTVAAESINMGISAMKIFSAFKS